MVEKNVYLVVSYERVEQGYHANVSLGEGKGRGKHN